VIYSCCSHSEHRASVKPFVPLQFLNSKHPVGLLGRVISPSQGRYLTQSQNKHRHPYLEWDSNPRSQRSRERSQFMPYSFVCLGVNNRFRFQHRSPDADGGHKTVSTEGAQHTEIPLPRDKEPLRFGSTCPNMRQHGIYVARQRNEHRLARQRCSIDTQL
jgi:hypothetical protein